MKTTLITTGLATLLIATSAGAATAPPYPVGNPLGLPVTPGADGAFNAISPGVKVYGSVFSAESCSYDPERGLIVIPNRGVGPNVQANDGWITLMNHDGSIHTPRWIGIQGPGQRAALTPPLNLDEPMGSDIIGGVLYVADRIAGAAPTDPATSVVRRFDMRTGAPLADIRVTAAAPFNDIEVAADGTLYGTIPGANQVWRVSAAGEAAIFVQGAPMNRPNGVAFDQQGNIVIVNTNSDAVLTYSPAGVLLRTETAAQSGSDGIVVMDDGVKYVSSVQNGGVSRIRPGQPAQLIAQNIPSAASMCYDSGARQLVIPMNANNAVAIVRLE